MLTVVVRIVAWNCFQKLKENLQRLSALEPDIAVIGEASAGTPTLPTGTGWLSKVSYPGSPKGIGVLAMTPWSLSAHPLSADAPGWVLPVRVSGPTAFTLLAMYTVVAPGSPSYTAQLAQVIADLVPAVNGEVVVAGDLNAPVPATLRAHLRNDAALRRAGLVSAYLASRQVDAAAAYATDPDTGAAVQEPTFFMHRRVDRPFHIDHVYLPERWATPRPAVEIGSHTQWVASGTSDHVPLIVDVEPN